IESISEGFVLFDSEDRVVMCNSVWRNYFKGVEDMIVPGARFDDIHRAGFERGRHGAVAVFASSTSRETFTCASATIVRPTAEWYRFSPILPICAHASASYPIWSISLPPPATRQRIGAAG